MYLDHTDAQKALRRELRNYFRNLMTPELLDATRGNEGGDAYQQVIRQIGTDGWLAIGWPKKFGGQGRDARDQLIFFEEAQLAGAPLPFVTINTVAPALMAHGSDEHKQRLLPKIAAGELHFAIGYTEPEAGTDLAALKTSAVRDGNNYTINGTKVFTSSAEAADYIWLAARTDPTVEKKHHGITIFMVPTDQPGFSCAPIHTVGDIRTNITYYDNVYCPADMIAGELNGGWKLIISQLNHERVGLAAIGVNAIGAFQQTLAWASEAHNDSRAIDIPWVADALAEAYNRLEAMRMMNWRMAWMMDNGQPDPAYASGMKAYSTESLIAVYRLLIDVVGVRGMIKRGGSATVLAGMLEEEYRKCQINTFGGGVAEVIRDLVASFGLGLNAYHR